jgi:hypothetical protein
MSATPARYVDKMSTDCAADGSIRRHDEAYWNEMHQEVNPGRLVAA